MKRTLRPIIGLLLMLMILFLSANDASAQRFSVASFKPLPNDVSAFINPVKDLNDDDCGLIKVIASEDFVFSTPLGIVKREDQTGEIWLYVPRGTKKLTIKHADYGVLRDYQLPQRIESHITYELRLDEPLRPAESKSASGPAVTTVRDTLVVTRVDTLVIAPVKKVCPLNFEAVATLSYGGRSPQALGGIMVMVHRRHGAFIHLASDFGRIGATAGTCDRYGYVGAHLPFYSGNTRRSAFMVNGGAVHRLSGFVSIFEGLGYAANKLAWKLAPSEGGDWLENNHYSVKGLSFEVGAMMSFKRVVVSASVSSIKGREWFGTVGVGIKFGKL